MNKFTITCIHLIHTICLCLTLLVYIYVSHTCIHVLHEYIYCVHYSYIYTHISHTHIYLCMYIQENPGAKSVLLSGPPGIGKTTIATLIAKEMGYEV